MLPRLVQLIDTFTRWSGERIKWLTTILVILIFGDVLLRYLFDTSKAWITDLEWHVFALIFLLAAAYTLKENQHVRVDVLYTKWSARRKAWINLLGTGLFLLPWCLIVIYTSFEYTGHAFAIGEKSAEPGGLPARFLVKGSITLGFVLLMLQGISIAFKALITLRKTEEPA
ncbi:MAG TPA: TRAP transporter small permease subunit [Saprospiraceae bacterium]|nr:TRAP transporter small permease subunit [Saprospiraceae bacterium]